jgi:hypothetical protein
MDIFSNLYFARQSIGAFITPGNEKNFIGWALPIVAEIIINQRERKNK